MSRLAHRWSKTRRERHALAYEDVADQIEDGSLTIRNADADKVQKRLQDKADRVRAGEYVWRKKSRRSIRVDSE